MKLDELSKFALTLSLLPCIPAYLLYKHSYQDTAIKVLIGFLFLALLCFISKKFAHFLKTLLTEIGISLSKYIAIIVLAIGYIVAVFPTGLITKLVKRDRLRLKKIHSDTYWVNNQEKDTDYEYQF